MDEGGGAGKIEELVKKHPEVLLIALGVVGLVVIVAMSGGGTSASPAKAAAPQSVNQPPGQGYVSSEMLQNALRDQTAGFQAQLAAFLQGLGQGSGGGNMPPPNPTPGPAPGGPPPLPGGEPLPLPGGEPAPAPAPHPGPH